LEDSGRVIQGSSSILDYLAGNLCRPALEPEAAKAEQQRELEALADRAFGVGVQRIAYSYLLDGPREGVIALFTQNGPWWGRAFYALAFPVVAKEIRRMYDVTPERVQEAKALFRSAFARFDAQLSDQPYLAGMTPGRLDITVAALLAPLCRPPEHPMHWPELPEPLAAFALELEGRPTWRHVGEMYRRHRQSPSQPTREPA
jgi:glutathione S-transferase